MKKIVSKFVIVFGIVVAINLLPQDSFLVKLLLTATLFFVSALLLTIIWALVIDMKMIQGLSWLPKSRRQKPGGISYSNIPYRDIKVSYLLGLHGGGIIFAHEFVRIISQRIGKVEHAFEYCAGPGFIGFSLLANNLCEKLTLADVNPSAVAAIKDTIRSNNLQNKAEAFRSDCLDGIPKQKRWDLVVSNPPWYIGSMQIKDIRVNDFDKQVHKKFYRNICKFLKPNGSVLFIEGAEYTNVDHFREMIEDNGLKIVEVIGPVKFFDCLKDLNEYSGIGIPLRIFLRTSLYVREAYFIWAKRNEPGQP